jgi:hypothetical protein
MVTSPQRMQAEIRVPSKAICTLHQSLSALPEGVKPTYHVYMASSINAERINVVGRSDSVVPVEESIGNNRLWSTHTHPQHVLVNGALSKPEHASSAAVGRWHLGLIT